MKSVGDKLGEAFEQAVDCHLEEDIKYILAGNCIVFYLWILMTR